MVRARSRYPAARGENLSGDALTCAEAVVAETAAISDIINLFIVIVVSSFRLSVFVMSLLHDSMPECVEKF